MIENSTAGLTLLDPDREVVVTREEHHQPALRRYAPHADARGRRVAVELRFAPISAGAYAGRRGIEALLDGQRVGELTAMMAQRYAPLVEHVLRSGGRAGCVAVLSTGKRGIEVELRLPVVADGAPAAFPAGPFPPSRGPRPPLGNRPPGGPTPDVPEAGGRPARRRRAPYWIGAGVATLLIVIGANVGGGTATVTATAGSTTPTAAATSSPTAPAAVVPAAAPEPGSTVTRSTAAAAAPRATPTRAPTPRTPSPRAAAPPATPQSRPAPAQVPAPKPASPAAPKAADGCDPNYGGCVPIATDVDCAGGSGNGPAYVQGPVKVTGTDIYGLDADKDGTGCDS